MGSLSLELLEGTPGRSAKAQGRRRAAPKRAGAGGSAGNEPGWRELWAVARYDLGLSDREFGELTSVEFEALLDRRTEERNRAQLNAGIVAAAICNAFRGQDSKPVSPIDFVPDYKEKAQRPQQTLEEQIAILTKIMGTGPGRRVN